MGAAVCLEGRCVVSRYMDGYRLIDRRCVRLKG
jgi:hypothetical protein